MNEGNPMQDRCGAHCRTTGMPCLNFPMRNGRCRMHGGKSTGPKQKHGYYSSESIKGRKDLSDLIQRISNLINSSSPQDDVSR